MFLELRVRPTVLMISAIRRSVISLYEQALDDVDAGARVGLATHELLENVLRHSVTGETTLHIDVDEPASRVRIETTNRASLANIEQLTQRALADGDPDELYQVAIVESLAQERIGGLGLARIRAEAGMTLDVRTEGDCVHVIATTSFGVAA